MVYGIECRATADALIDWIHIKNSLIEQHTHKIDSGQPQQRQLSLTFAIATCCAAPSLSLLLPLANGVDDDAASSPLEAAIATTTARTAKVVDI